MLSYAIKPYEELLRDELYEILKIRQEVFIVEQNCPYLDADDLDKQSLHVIGTDQENQIAAYARILSVENKSDQEIKIGRVLTLNSVRGEGLGRQLMQETINYCKQNWPSSKIKVSAQSYLLQFYQSLGFEEIGSEYLEDGIPHKAMILS